MGASKQIIYFTTEEAKIEFLTENVGKECWVGTNNIHCKLDELPKNEYKDVKRFYDENYNVSDLVVEKKVSASYQNALNKLNQMKKGSRK